MSDLPERSLSPELLAAGRRIGNEWGWPPELIPRVIDEAEALGLLSLGGQLQFVPPEGTCECYWVSVDPTRDMPKRLPWPERVRFAAEAARRDFAVLARDTDFRDEIEEAFPTHLQAFEAAGGDLSAALRFVWYLETQELPKKRRLREFFRRLIRV